MRNLLPAIGAAVIAFLVPFALTFDRIKDHPRAIWAPMTFGLAAFTIVVTLREMFLPAWVRVREKHEGMLTAVIESAARARRRFGGYIVHLGVVVVIIAIAASRTYVSHTSGTLKKGESLSLSGYTLTFDGLKSGREPHRDWIGAALNVSGRGHADGESSAMLPRLNFYETSTDPVGSPAVQTSAREDLYVSLMAYDEKANSASFKVWVFPLVAWIWWAIPIFAIGTLIAVWPTRRARIASAIGTAPATLPVPGLTAASASGDAAAASASPSVSGGVAS